MSRRWHNLIFALLLGLVLGVTAYSVYSRMPSLGLSPYSIQISSEAESRESNKANSQTERMIESGELSDHPAKYYKVLEQ